jgi:hypothetical protein
MPAFGDVLAEDDLWRAVDMCVRSVSIVPGRATN